MISESNRLKDLFLSLGYSLIDFKKIINLHSFNRFKEDTLYNNINSVYNYFINLGYSKDEVIKITKEFPTILSYGINTISKKIDDIILLGYSKNDVLKMIKHSSNICGYSIDNIRNKINELINLGYSKDEALCLSITLPTIFNLSMDNIKQKIDDIISLGYSKEEVFKMTKILPTIFNLSIENIKSKLDFYDSIDLHDLAVINTKYLMQSVTLSYARYMLYKDMGININISNYSKLFVSEKSFEKQFGISRSELLEKYNYNKYLEGIGNGRAL